MAFLRIRLADVILFQLIRKDLSNPSSKWTEVSVFPMAVKPKILSYQYGSRSAIQQTIPDNGFIDKYGSQLTRVTMSGTFGVQPRRIGLDFQDGYTRLLNFRDDLFKISQQAVAIKSDGAADYVYAVNYYDFINDERFLVNLDQFTIDTDAVRNPIEPTYNLSFTSLGPIITEAVSSDPLLVVLNAFSDAMAWTLSQGQALLDTGFATKIVDVAGIFVVGLEECSFLWNQLGNIGALYGAAVAAQIVSAKGLSKAVPNAAVNNPVSRTAEAFVSVKG